MALAMALRTSSSSTHRRDGDRIDPDAHRGLLGAVDGPSATAFDLGDACAMTLSATSYMLLAGMVFEVSARIRTGAADGLTLRMAGQGSADRRADRSGGVDAACTSRAAPSMRVGSKRMVHVWCCRANDEFDLGDGPGFRRAGTLQRRRRRSGRAMMLDPAPGRLAPRTADGPEFRSSGMLDTGRKPWHRAGQNSAERQERVPDRAKDEGTGKIHRRHSAAVCGTSPSGPRHRRNERLGCG